MKMLYAAKAFFYKILFKHYRILKPFAEKIIPYRIQDYFIAHYKNNHASSMSMLLKEIHTKTPSINSSLASGVNIIGFVRHVFGLSQQALTIGRSLQKQRVPMAYIDVGYLTKASPLENPEILPFISEKNIYNCNLFSLNSDLFLHIYLSKEKDFFKNRYNIHYGAWELENYPKLWVETSNIMHEFWAMSQFVQKSVQDALSIPVFLMPYAIDFDIPQNSKRSDFDLPDDLFLFMFSYDMSSKNARKNPKAVLEAFRIAFPKEKEVGLVIKVMRNKDRQSHNDELIALKKTAQENKNIYLIDNILSDKEMRALVNVCDVYVSLHRSEGFGMGMAEAMKMGKAVIATNYSGNTDFTLPETACMVDYKLIDVGRNDYIHYEAGQKWADPYSEQAADYMRKLFYDSVFYKQKSLSGKSFIDTHYNHAVIGSRFVSRLKDIGIFS